VRRRSNRLQVSDMSEEDPFGFGADDSEGNADPFQSEDLHVQGGFDAFGGEDENSGFGDELGADAGDQAAEYGNLEDEQEFVQPSTDVPAMDSQPAVAAADVQDDDDAALKAFERKFQAEVGEKDAKSQAQRAEMKEAAKKELDGFLAEKKVKNAAKLKLNREEEQEFMNSINDALTAENPWERIYTLVDVASKPSEDKTDVTRLKNILIQLKNAPVA